MEADQFAGFDIDSKRNRLQQLLSQLQSPEIASDYQKAGEINQEVQELTTFIDIWDTYDRLYKQLIQAHELLASEPDMADISAAEISQLTPQVEAARAKLEELTTAKLPDDHRPALIEIRAGTGGVEANLFAEEILRMYTRYFTAEKLEIEQVHTNPDDAGGIKEAILKVLSPGAYGKLRFESGVHRVQRVPVTESKGRIHTSAISVVILPEIPWKEISIPETDIRIDVFRSGGPGGQGVNRTDSAVRVTHLPTQIVISCQDSRSQHRNKEQALSVLASKLRALQMEQDAQSAKDIRASSIQGGDRSAKIRTYNFPQGRITDHRIGQSWFNITEVMEGNLGEIVNTVNSKLRKQLAAGEAITAIDDKE